MLQTYDAPRRRRWPWILITLVVLIGALWTGGWYYAASKVDATVAGWKAREAKAGRHYNCGGLAVSGFPFQIEVRCTEADADLRSPSLLIKTKEILVAAAIWQPTALNGEFTGPMTVREPGASTSFLVNWERAQTQMRGLPTAPESAWMGLDEPTLDRVSASSREPVFKARRAELNGRIVSGSARENPVIEAVLKLVNASAPSLHPAAARPIDADVTAVLRGLKDFSPKPWPARFREIQAANGRIEIVKARLQQGETIAVAEGVLGLSPRGRLDGQLRLTVANLEKLLPTLGLDRLVNPQTAPTQLNSAFNALDRFAPGLGNVARQNAGPALAASVNLLGQSAELEGQRAVTIPLRFNDGMVMLGPLQLGQTPPLF